MSNPGSLLRSKSTRRDRRCEAASERLVNVKFNSVVVSIHYKNMLFSLSTDLLRSPVTRTQVRASGNLLSQRSLTLGYLSLSLPYLSGLLLSSLLGSLFVL